MDVFDLRDRLVGDYASYTRSFIKIADRRISETVDSELNAGALWPEPLLQLNPTFLPGGSIDDLVSEGILHSDCSKIFRIDKTTTDLTGNPLILHTHQRDAILKAKEGKSYVLTSGTGSGKSLTYIVPIVDHVLRRGSGQGIQAIVVYPMNALANSQVEELKKFLEMGYRQGASPVSFARYTGQESLEEREEIRKNPPDILLTNYMMLELMLTRAEDRDLVRSANGLKFLVFDELHTYRGRQGADVALLIRRSRLAFGGHDIVCVGTSATMASEGTSEDQKSAVAGVAQTLFGTSFDPSQVIGETLERATPELDFAEPAVLARLLNAITSDNPAPEDYETFRTNELSSWIESTFGVQTEDGSARLIRQTPKRLSGNEGAAERLAELTGAPIDTCDRILREFFIKGSELRRGPSSRFPIFAFRLHQFLTRGDTVWTTIESENTRFLSLSKLIARPGQLEKPMYPLVFCRQCGAEYYRVKSSSENDIRILLPRDARPGENDDGTGDGYIYASSIDPWPAGVGSDLLSRLPAFMKETTADGSDRIRSDARKDLPENIWVDSSGQVVSEGAGIQAAFISKNFLFCLNSTCGVAYTRDQRSERSKLTTLGVDSRSTATTILAVRSLIELQRDSSLDRKARKLLSFTDNRQDASLQAGHFNDFAHVALIRSALLKAATAKGNQGLTHATLSRDVSDSLALAFEEYASDPDVRGPARVSTEDALRRIIDYYVYQDLTGDWRVTAPNLEDCGLISFKYDGLTGDEGLLAETELWSTGFEHTIGRNHKEFLEVPEPLSRCTFEVREEIILTLLDVLRRSLAIKVDVLDPQKQLDLIQQTTPRLAEGTSWYLDDTRNLKKSGVAFPRSKRDRGEFNNLFLSSYGRFGRYLKRTLTPHIVPGHSFGRDDVDQAIRFLLFALKRYGVVEQVRDGRNGDDPGFQINHDAMRWVAGEGLAKPVDRTRMAESGESAPEVNKYFVECYQRFVDLKCNLEAREHTAQVAADDREERETRFRDGDLPLMFCSPTMELGVDIAELNVVNMRNVPPTPANYAQRSGRAGRGGQPALVYTYCAGQSPHDQYYYRQPTHMVAGSVAPPRIDLQNRDLIKSHIHAIWMEVVKPDLGKTLMSVLEPRIDEGRILLPVKDSLEKNLNDPAHRATALLKANSLIEALGSSLLSTPWYHENWTKEVLDQIFLTFDAACNRWRSLYRSAVRQREIHHRVLGDHARPDVEREHSRRLRAQAEAQIRLLTEAEGVFEGDFYSYRYFAAEGFLPGYNFPRLPISAFVPARRRRRGRDEFVSRPRFLAISEFGPRALIYHEGARYRVHKVNLDFGTDEIEETHSIVTNTIKRCQTCAYAHMEYGANLADVCDRCGNALDGRAVIENLVQLQNVSLKTTQRITCDEEERQRFGYKLVSSYRFPEVGGKLDRRDADALVDGIWLMRMSYGDSTTLYRINLGWANQRDDQAPGFLLDLERGYWGRNQADNEDQDDATATRQARVVPFVTDTKNALVISLNPTRPPDELVSLQAALKEAIQKHFQIESRELSADAMPSNSDRREVLFYESSEGGAGVLRQLVEDPAIIPMLARRALEICHFDPDTLEDLRPDSCGKACYECLLDYFNQPDHQILDRYVAKGVLTELLRSECKPAGGMGSRNERMVELRKQCDSGLEKKWLDLIDKFILRPPSDAQYLIEKYSTRPDFFYREFNAAIYVDGPVHDEADQIRYDDAINDRLKEAGYIVIRFHHKDDWSSILTRHPDVFGTLSDSTN